MFRTIYKILILLALLPSVAAAQCWLASPASSSGQQDSYPVCSTLWDPDGSGPLPAWLVIGQPAPSGGVTNVLAWTGSQWYTLGDPFNGEIASLAVYGGQLYAGGGFTQIGATQVNSIARWNGNSWEQVGVGLGTIQGAGAGGVGAMLVYGNVLYVGGRFKAPGSDTYVCCAAWALLGAGEWVSLPQIGQTYDTPVINCFCNHNNTLYAGISAHNSGLATGVYRYNTTVWNLVGDTGTYNDVIALASYNGQLIAGGDFAVISGVGASCIAQWNGSAWAPMGAGLSPRVLYDRIIALTVFNGSVIAGGHFHYMNGQPMTKVAAWNGATWSPLGAGIAFIWTDPIDLDAVWALNVYNNQLVAMGAFFQAGSYAANDIAYWNGADWFPFTEGINGAVRVFYSTGSYLDVGGDFDFTLNSASYHHLLGTDTVSISEFAAGNGFNGVNGPVYALSQHRFNVLQPPSTIIGGSFSSAQGANISNIVSYSFLGGFAPFGSGVDGAVYALADFQNSIYAAGAFLNSGSTPLPHFAKWAGASGWVAPGAWTLRPIHAMMVYNGQLTISGVNGNFNGASAWNGTTLTSLGTADGPVLAFANFNGDLVAAGTFTTIGGVPATRIARRDSATGQWSAMGPGFNADVNALAVHFAELYAGGVFTASGGTTVHHLAKWTGSSWEEVSTGVDGPVYALASFDNRLQVGGSFGQSYTPRILPYWGQCTCGCYANCDLSSAQPVLNVNDFICFLNKFAAGDNYANCDGSTTAPILNVLDFTCFLNRFAVGCP